MKYRIDSCFNAALSFAGLLALAPTLAEAQTAIPESFALPTSALDTSKPGFVVRVSQVPGAEQPNTILRAENQLAGLLTDSSGAPLPNIADTTSFNADGTYTEEFLINYDAGYFPGIPGLESTTINIALEAITYVQYEPGTYSMVITGDDGAKLSVGNVYDRLSELTLVESPSTSDKVATFTISKAGVYGFRVVFEQGGGGYSLGWYTADPNDASNRTLLNDAGVSTCYRALKSGSVVMGPSITAVSPLPNSTGVSASGGLTAVIRDGSSALDASSLKLYYNGSEVTASATVGPKSGNTTKVVYNPSTRPEPNAVESYKLVFADPSSTNGTREATISYTVASYADYVLPDPVWLETFDGVAEGQLPAGWTTESPIDPAGYEDLNDPKSDSYRVWVVISKQRVSDITSWNASQRLNTPEAYINGKRVESLIDNQFAYNESDVRSGSQYAELFSPNVDLTGKTDIYLVYNSIRTQNQDDIAGVEYSIDGGATWLPVLYMIDKDDIVKNAQDATDPEATLNAERTDATQYTDPNTGEVIGLSYGAFVKAAKSTWANLGSYISGRINDDQMESKRIEKYRLPQADNQSKVKLRFFQAGTGSWFFGVDNVGLYSISAPQAPQIAAQPVGGVISGGSGLTLSVNATGTEPLAYQWKHNGSAIANATNATYEIVGATAAAAGEYVVQISNAGGSVSSARVNVTVFTGPIADNLVAHLKFDGTLTDATGRGNAGTAVGSVSYATGKAGQAMQISSDADYVTLGTPADLNFGTTNDFSIAFWTKVGAWDGDPSFIGNKDWNSGGNPGYALAADGDGHFQWNLAGSPGSRKDYDGPAGLFSDNGWHHIVVTFQRSGVASTFVDGVLKDSKPIGADLNNLDTPSGKATNIGQDGTGAYGSKFSDVTFDDIGIWRRVVTPQEVAAIYEAGQAGKDLSTVVLNTVTDAGSIAIARSAGKVVLSWDGGAKLQSAPAITGPWTEETAGSPATMDATGTAKFYRLAK